MKLVDSHVNLHSEKYDEDLPVIIENARNAGVVSMLTISDKLSSTPAIEAISKQHSFISRSLGVHPHYANEYPDLKAEELVELAKPDDVVGIGECGLDFHYNYSPRDIQIAVFEAHIKASQETHLPLIIHTREADEEMQSALETAHQKAEFLPLLHCYTGGPALAESVLALGGYISFSGIMTFKNADDVREIAVNTPLDRIIIETDCPYLAPVPMRGRRNEPAYLIHVAEKLAELHGKTLEEIATITTDNYFNLFARAPRPITLTGEKHDH